MGHKCALWKYTSVVKGSCESFLNLADLVLLILHLCHFERYIHGTKLSKNHKTSQNSCSKWGVNNSDVTGSLSDFHSAEWSFVFKKKTLSSNLVIHNSAPKRPIFFFSHLFCFCAGPHAETASGCQNLQCGFRACCRSGEWPLTSDLSVYFI